MSDLVVWNELGNIYFKLGACEEAIAVYEKAIEVAPDFGWPYSNLGLVYAHQGQYAQAIPLYRRSIELFKNDRDKAITWNRLGDAYRRLNDPKNAMAAYQKAVQLDVGELERAYFGGKEAARSGVESDGSGGDRAQDVKAVQVSGNAPKTGASGDDMSAWLNQLEDEQAAGGDERVGEDKELQEWLQTSAAGSPEAGGSQPAVQAVRESGHYWVLDTNFPLAPKPASSALIKWVPEEANRYRLPSRHPQAAEGSTGAAVDEMDPSARFMLLVKGATEPEACRPESTQTVSAQQLAGSAEAQPPVENKRQTGKLEDAAAAYANIAATSPSNDRVWDALGNSLRSLGRYEEAVSAFEHAIALAPDKEEYHYHLGLVYAAQKCHESAIEAFQKVIRLNPGYALAHGALAGSYRRLGREAEAVQQIQIARPAMEAEKEYNRACFEAICGNTDQALEYLRVALVTKQTPLEWMRSDPDLECLHDDQRFQELLDQEA